MASEDVLKKAVAAFNALSPEQQAEMMEEQRQSWVRGNVGLSRDERGIASPVMPRPAPAATDTGLVTVAEAYINDDGECEEINYLHNGLPSADGFTELVTRSQAEKLLAAERADHDNTIATLSSLIEDNAALIHDLNRIKDHETELVNDNDALTARIKELEQINANLMGDDEDKPRYTTKRLKLEIARATEALEAKLAAAEKALEFYADASKWNDGYFKSEDDGTVLRAYPSSIEKDQGDKARAVLGGKP